MKNSTYCYWLLASTLAGNRVTDAERKLMNEFLSKHERNAH